MLAKVWDWLCGRSSPQRVAQAGGQVAARRAAAPLAASRAAGSEGRQPYSALLALKVGELAPLSPSEEQETSALVEGVVDYVRTHAIDPPVMPALATRMLELLREPELDVAALARLLERDQASAAKVMSVANSAAFRGASEIGTLRDAIVYLGSERVAQIAIGLATRALFESASTRSLRPGPDRFARLFQHAMTSAFAACQLATRRNLRHSEAAFLGGLFHDVGKAVALRALTEMCNERQLAPPPERVIDSALQLIHREPRVLLYDAWQLPRALLDMCRHHHQLPAEPSPELHFVRLASGLDALRTGVAAEQRDALEEVAESAAALGFSDAELRAADSETRGFGERVAVMFR